MSDQVQHIVKAMSEKHSIHIKKMFGEYGVYCHGTFIGVIVNHSLFLKKTEPGMAFVGDEQTLEPAYPGARPSIRITEEQLSSKRWLSELITITEKALRS